MLLSKFLAKAMPLLKQLMVAFAKDSPTSVMTSKSFLHQQHSMKTPEKVDISAHSDVSLAKRVTDTANGEKRA